MFEDGAERDEIEMAVAIFGVLDRSEFKPIFAYSTVRDRRLSKLGRRLESVRVEPRGRERPHRFAEPCPNVERAHPLAKAQQTLRCRYLMSKIVRLIFELFLGPVIFRGAVVSFEAIGDRLRIGEDQLA